MKKKKQTTIQQYTSVMAICRSIFVEKTKDYGTSWRILRPSSLTDQLYIKAKRIRTLEMTDVQKIEENVEDAYRALVNYSVMALIQDDMGWLDESEISMKAEDVMSKYDEKLKTAKTLMKAKNHDYGEAWRSMRISSFTDLILAKLLRIKEIENNAGKTVVSEGSEGNYLDIINYAVFALIKLEEQKPNQKK